MEQSYIDELLTIPRTEVSSSQIKNLAWHKQHLLIEFHSGGQYVYHPITEEGFLEFTKAASVGSYFHKHIKNNGAISYKSL